VTLISTSIVSAATDRVEPATSHRSARAAVGLAGGFAGVVVALHALKPEMDPSWRMVSEYEIGRHGWLMRSAFVCLGAACVALFVALQGRVSGRTARVGRLALLAAAAGTILAGVFVSDPITATKAELTTSGNLHGFGAMLGIPGLLLASTLLTRNLARSSAPSTAVTALRVAAVGAWASIAAFAVTMGLTYDGAFSSDVPVGVPNRLLIVTYVVWIVAAARLTESRLVRQD
jgi:hypothetical protein